MFNVNLEKELNKVHSAALEKSKVEKSIQKEVKLLLSAAETQDRKILDELGLNHSILIVEKERGFMLEKETFEKDYKVKMFTEEELKNLCIKYNLRLLRSNRFIGKVDIELTAKVNAFLKANPTVRLEHDNQYFYIMAPKKCFRLDDRPPRINTAWASDPVLFYKVNNRNGEPLYGMIHKWGNEFNIFRLITSWPMRKISNFIITFYTSALLLVMSLVFSLTNVTEKFEDVVAACIFIPLLLVIPILIVVAYLENKTADNSWNSVTK